MNPPYEKKMYKQMLDKMVNKIKSFRIFYYVFGGFVEQNEIFDYKCKVIDGILSTLYVFGLTNASFSMLLLQFGKGIKSNITDKLTLPVFNPKKDKYDNWTLNYKRNITFKKKETLRKYIEKQIADKYDPKEKLLTTMTFLDTPKFGRKGKYKVCRNNLQECLLFSGIFFNSHTYYYDDMFYVSDKDFDKTFIADALLLAMCYFTNQTQEGFSIFDESELGLPAHSLKSMLNKEMFYDFTNKYKNDLSAEAKDLREKTLAMYRWYFKHFGIKANKNVSFSELKLAIMQDKVDVSFKKANNKISVMGYGGTRIGENSKWTPSKADRLHNTTIFIAYDKALLALQTKMYERFIKYGMIDEMPKNVR
jgi:hypothetical protein